MGRQVAKPGQICSETAANMLKGTAQLKRGSTGFWTIWLLQFCIVCENLESLEFSEILEILCHFDILTVLAVLTSGI